MSPLVVEVVEAISNKLRNPLLVFVLVLNLAMLAFIYFGVLHRREQDHQLLQKMMAECVNK